MRINCIHCGGAFTVRGEQLGTTVSCPHCRGPVNLPRADTGEEHHAEEEETRKPSGLLKDVSSGLISLVIHTAILIIIVLWPQDARRGLPGEGEEVLIGTLASEVLSDSEEDSLDSTDQSTTETTSEGSLEELEINPLDELSDPTSTELIPSSPSTFGGSAGESFDIGMVSSAGGGEGGGWGNMLQQLRRDGLDVVLVFDSTGSMSGEIREVKGQIQRIGTSLTKLVPKVRIGVCTYRDRGDPGYVVKGFPLTNDVQEISTWLRPIHASGGGDYEEAVESGLAWVVEHNEFRPRARKVILLFGDAPPHPQDRTTCMRLAADFHRQQKGVVSTVTCHSRVKLKDFVEIAQVGGGEAFLTTDEEQIMTQLMVLVFGSRYRGKVVEAFELIER